MPGGELAVGGYPGQYEIGLAVRNSKATGLQAPAEPVPLGADLAVVFQHGLLIHYGFSGQENTKGIAIVAVLDLVQAGDELAITQSKAETQAGQGITFGKSSQNQNVLVLVDQRKAITVGKVHVGFINNQDALNLASQARDLVWRSHCAAGRVRIAQQDKAGLSLEEFGGQGPVRLKRNLHKSGILDVGQSAVQGIGGHRISHNTLWADKSPGGHSQQLIRAVAADDLVGRYVKDVGGGFSEQAGIRVGVSTKSIRIEIPQSSQNGRTGQIRILVGVELDHGGVRGLLAGHVAEHPLNIVSKICHCCLFSNRTEIDRLCISRPSVLANSSTSEVALVRASLL